MGLPGRQAAFVLMPFAAKFDDLYNLGIQDACKSFGIQCTRVDQQIFEELIISRIYDQIRDSDIVIADMTDRNPNVFYEVGYAHGIGKRVILLASSTDDIPFDLRMHQHIVYFGSITTAKNRLREVLESLKSIPVTRDYSLSNLEITTLSPKRNRVISVMDFISLSGGDSTPLVSGMNHNVPAEISNFGSGFHFQFALQIINRGNSEIDLSPLEWEVTFPKGVTLAEGSLREGLGRTTRAGDDLTIPFRMRSPTLRTGASEEVILHLKSTATQEDKKEPDGPREYVTSLPVNITAILYDEIWKADINLVFAPWRRLN